MFFNGMFLLICAYFLCRTGAICSCISLPSFLPCHSSQALRGAFPQFAELTNEGYYMQHDAEECLSHLTTAMAQHIKGGNQQNVVDQIFGGKVEVK